MIHELFHKVSSRCSITQLVDGARELLSLNQAQLSNLTTSFQMQQHPLGFLAYRWLIDETHSLRLHVWDERFGWGQDPRWSIHDHLFGFTSLVLTGSVSNCEYQVCYTPDADGEWSEYEVHYERNNSILRKVKSNLSISPAALEIHNAGSFYEVKSGTAHKSDLLSARAITLLATTSSASAKTRPRVWARESIENLEFDRIVSSSHLAQCAILDAIDDLSKTSA